MSAGDRQAGPPAADLFVAGASLCESPAGQNTSSQNASGQNASGQDASGQDASGQDAPIAWSVDDADGWLQGPLELCYLGARRLSLALRAGQSALLVDDDRVLASFGPGTHDLAIGCGDAGIDPACRLVFFAAGEGPTLIWSAASPLRSGDPGTPALTGACGLAVVDPALFFETFLAGGGLVDPSFVQLLVDRLVQDGLAGPGPGIAEATRPEDLTAMLAPCGLACRQLALHATPAAASQRTTIERPVVPA